MWPEATPNPRTVKFRTGPIHGGESRPYAAGSHADDARVARLFDAFDDISDVLLASDFVAVSLRQPARWRELLGPVLDMVTEEFSGQGGAAGHGDAPPEEPRGPERPGRQFLPRDRDETRLERAWRELGHLRASAPGDLARIKGAARHDDAARRQVAANLLREAEAGTAQAEWARLADDSSRAVRRATVDAVVDVGREELRPLLEQALGDQDPWVRWKAVRGLLELGAGDSREAVERLVLDPDFRVRQEALSALHR